MESTLREYNSPQKQTEGPYCGLPPQWGARLIKQPLPWCWSTNHVPSWICIFGMFTG